MWWFASTRNVSAGADGTPLYQHLSRIWLSGKQWNRTDISSKGKKSKPFPVPASLRDASQKSSHIGGYWQPQMSLWKENLQFRNSIHVVIGNSSHVINDDGERYTGASLQNLRWRQESHRFTLKIQGKCLVISFLLLTDYVWGLILSNPFAMA